MMALVYLNLKAYLGARICLWSLRHMTPKFALMV